MTKRRSAAEEDSCGLVIITRNPVFKETKTRLAADVGPVKALAIYDQLLSICQAESSASRFSTLVFYSDFIDPYDGWQGAVSKFRQVDADDLGVRIASAIRLGLLSYDRVLVIGSDCPDINVALLDRAYDSLSSVDSVLGPAADGGFYLLGVKGWDDRWFDGVTWGGDGVFDRISRNLTASNQSMAILNVLSDIDRVADWKDYLARNSTPH